MPVSLPETIEEAITDFIYLKSLARSKGTARAYANGLKHFVRVLTENDLAPESASPETLADLRYFLSFVEHLQSQNLAATTQKLYSVGVYEFYKYLAARSLAEINLSMLTELIKQQVRQPGYRLPQFPKADIETMLSYAQDMSEIPTDTIRDRRINLRDRAFILALADTGLRVHEACQLKRGDVDWNEGRAITIGKGNKQAIIRFSERSLQALRDYLAVRRELDGATGKQLSALPLFARHDDGGEKKVKPISPDTGRNIVKRRVRQILGEDAVGTITPHSFRHYFVTTILQATGGNIHIAQKLARHSSISVTERYAHLADNELDQNYDDVFNQS